MDCCACFLPLFPLPLSDLIWQSPSKNIHCRRTRSPHQTERLHHLRPRTHTFQIPHHLVTSIRCVRQPLLAVLRCLFHRISILTVLSYYSTNSLPSLLFLLFPFALPVLLRTIPLFHPSLPFLPPLVWYTPIVIAEPRLFHRNSCHLRRPKLTRASANGGS